MQNKLHGVIVPVVTPVDSQDRVDEPAFRRLIRDLGHSGVHALFVGGSAGEGPLLVGREWQRMIEIAVDENRGAVPLLGGAIDTSTCRVKDKIRALSAAGYHYVVITPTFYVALQTGAEHLRLFGECAEAAAGMEMIAYNIPSATGSTIPVEVVCELARHQWIHYCKESSGDLAYFKRLLVESAGTGLDVFMGDEVSIAQGLLAGACGIVPVCANYEPATFISAYEAGRAGDKVALDQAQERIITLKKNLVMAGPNWIAGLKYAVSLKGIGSGKPVSPLQSLDDAQQKAVEQFHRTAQARGAARGAQ